MKLQLPEGMMKNTPRIKESQGAHYRITSSDEVIVEFPVRD